ncbi:hypothetical protein KIN20_028216 [Parelaphostrongylus tenuis]|uniref:Uncharacterized protein n=1 Tax=Parelaphostrongylus tenuis TaxID=148309 RepID=A0AAD5R0H7_PARTN|nr:hypothetical protein KIN20_028216 [Parelaphostrongylus tenuis]
MVYSTSPDVSARVPGISNSQGSASSLVSRLIMQSINDVLEEQARRAGLPDAISSMILNQLTVRINYNPLECKSAVVDQSATMAFMGVMMDKQPHCIIVGSTVTALCTALDQGPQNMCMISTSMNIQAISTNQMTILGTLTTTNTIMANWSRMMWQSVVSRAVRMLAIGPYGSHFFSAVATVTKDGISL